MTPYRWDLPFVGIRINWQGVPSLNEDGQIQCMIGETVILMGLN